MEKKIVELKLKDLLAVAGGRRFTVSASATANRRDAVLAQQSAALVERRA